MPWKTFLKAHFGVIAATDFFTVEVLTLGGLVRYVVWFVIDLESRRVHIAGLIRHPHDAWIQQIARNEHHTDPRTPHPRTANDLALHHGGLCSNRIPRRPPAIAL
jgi:hypothetical protein